MQFFINQRIQPELLLPNQNASNSQLAPSPSHVVESRPSFEKRKYNKRLKPESSSSGEKPEVRGRWTAEERKRFNDGIIFLAPKCLC